MKLSSECILWSGWKNPKGYGLVHSRDRKRNIPVHRIVLALAGIRIPKGMVVDHLCRVRNCMNVEHLEVVTPKENVLRGTGITAKNKRKIRCLKGHLLSGRNLYRYCGARQCKKCQRERVRRWRNRMAAKKHKT